MVAVARIHVRLDLENDCADMPGSACQTTQLASAVCARGCGAMAGKRIEQIADAEILQRTAEEDLGTVASP